MSTGANNLTNTVKIIAVNMIIAITIITAATKYTTGKITVFISVSSMKIRSPFFKPISSFARLASSLVRPTPRKSRGRTINMNNNDKYTITAKPASQAGQRAGLCPGTVMRSSFF